MSSTWRWTLKLINVCYKKPINFTYLLTYLLIYLLTNVCDQRCLYHWCPSHARFRRWWPSIYGCCRSYLERSASAHRLGTLTTSFQSLAEELPLRTVLPMTVKCLQSDCCHCGYFICSVHCILYVTEPTWRKQHSFRQFMDGETMRSRESWRASSQPHKLQHQSPSSG